MRLRTLALLLLALALGLHLAPARAEEEEPQTPAERVAELKRELAEEHADLGVWAAGKKLGRLAMAHLRIAVRLDPDCQKARQKLGHRRGPSGAWVEKREKEVAYAKSAIEKHGDELTKRESALLARETEALETLGRALLDEGEAELGRGLCLRAHILAPQREGAAAALGLVRIRHGWGTSEAAEAVSAVPEPADAGIRGLLSRTLDTPTVVRRCGSAVAETASDRAAADFLAKSAHQAQLLTSLRFGLPPKGVGWVNLVVANGQAQFFEFIEKLGFRDPYLSALKQLGTARAFRPVPFTSSFVSPAGDPKNRAPLFAHCVAEWVVIEEKPQKMPAWLYESVGLDACLTTLGCPGPLCVAFERSQGLTQKDLLEEPADWPRLLLRRAGMDDAPRLELLVRAQIQALGAEDVIGAHAVYRWLLLTRREALGDYVRRCAREEGPEQAFAGAFGMSPEEATAAFTAFLAGG